MFSTQPGRAHEIINNRLTCDTLFGVISASPRIITFPSWQYNLLRSSDLRTLRVREDSVNDGTFHADLPMCKRYPPVTSKKNVLSAMVGLAMLTLPASALAGNHQNWDDQPRPYARHDHGWHRGWLKHHGPDAVRPIEDEDDESEHCHFSPGYQPPAFLCDEDGDDCGPTNQGYEEDDDYGPPISYYQAEPPLGDSLTQQRNWLIQRRQAAYNALYAMRVRHDGPAARRVLTVIRSLDARIAHANQLLAGGGYIPSLSHYRLAPNSDYVFNPDSAYSRNYDHDGNSAFNPSYGTSPALNAIAGMIAPLLGSPSSFH